jgi:hypothetical protein
MFQKCVLSPLSGWWWRQYARTSETSVYFNETKWHYIPESSHLHTCCHENLKSYKVIKMLRALYRLIYPRPACLLGTALFTKSKRWKPQTYHTKKQNYFTVADNVYQYTVLASNHYIEGHGLPYNISSSHTSVQLNIFKFMRNKTMNAFVNFSLN